MWVMFWITNILCSSIEALYCFGLLEQNRCCVARLHQGQASQVRPTSVVLPRAATIDHRLAPPVQRHRHRHTHCCPAAAPCRRRGPLLA